jgi:rhamnosyltransferase
MEGNAGMIDVVVRCHNEMPHAGRTLAALADQSAPEANVLFIDSGSTDGSRDAAERRGVRILDLEASAYVPGRVLNQAMEATQSPVVVFLNADAVPLSPDALVQLVAPLFRPNVVATFGRQVPRTGADPQTRLDHLRAFGPEEPVETARGKFFSMAASALRRDAWERLRFDEHLAYSEDVDWVRRASALGWESAYAPEARFEKSRHYDLRGHWQRRMGEGAADAVIYRLASVSWLADWAVPLTGALARDVRAGILSPRSLATRFVQASGYYAGRRRATAPW